MDIARQRLHRTFLAGSSHATGRDVVRALGAVQAQDFEGAKWALSKRAAGTTETSLEEEFASGQILRTHMLRPTWHFVDPLDIRWLLALTGPRVRQTMAVYDRRLGLDEATFRRSDVALTKALRDGAYLTRTELKEVLARAKVALGDGTSGVQRMAHLMMRAELDSVICSGPRKGKQFTYALLDERAPTTDPKDRDEALLELTSRYFRTRSPATAQDFSWWSGLSMADARRGIDLARAELEPVTIDGVNYWTHGELPRKPKPSAHLLPNYDEFFIGYRDRSAIGRRLGSLKSVSGGNAIIANVITVDGQLVGGWRRSPGRETVRLDVKVLSRLTPAEQKRLSMEIRRFETYLGRPVELRGLTGGKPRLRSAR
jgi:winged helix DNA-binding protein